MPFPSLPSGGRFPKPLLPIAMGVAGIGLAAVIVSQQQQMKQLEGQLQLSRQQVKELGSKNETLTQQVSALESDREGLDARRFISLTRSL